MSNGPAATGAAKKTEQIIISDNFNIKKGEERQDKINNKKKSNSKERDNQKAKLKDIVSNEKHQKPSLSNESNLIALERDQLNLMKSIINLPNKEPSKVTKVKSTEDIDNKPKEEEVFTEIRYNKNKRRHLVVGKGDAQTTIPLRAVEKKAFLFATRFDPNTTAEDIKKHVSSVCESEVVKLDLKSKNSTASFKIMISFPNKDKVLNENFWPKGIVLNRYYFPKQQSISKQGGHNELNDNNAFLEKRM